MAGSRSHLSITTTLQLLLPVRIGASIAYAPAFSRIAIEPLKRIARKLRRS